ncbi:MAG: hypothetical protein EBT36_11435 [Betaproteobacteria bacterium]|nr:hypothetical protein [Betaproteobacteria bacterium]
MKATYSTTQRIAGIDGLRAIAVIAVMVFHADYDVGRGGYLGVDVFFVISGFLITGILLRELRRDGAISFADFFERRARRILPAMLAVIGGTALACQLLRPDALPALGNDAIASLLMLANWHFVLNGISYFEKFEGYRMLEHFWSLALEEQFYMAWPLVVLAIATRWGRSGLGFISATLALASAAWMGWLAYSLGFPESMDINRVYFGTDTHAVGLLVGAALACSGSRIKAYVRKHHQPRREAMACLLAIGSVTGALFLLTQLAENHPLLYPLGFVATSLCSAGLMLAFILSQRCGKVFDLQPMKWIGERSYGIYLWHWPVFALTRPGLDIDLPQDQAFLLRCAITFTLAALSYDLLETPMLSRSTSIPTVKRQRIALFVLSTAVVAGLSVFVIQTEQAESLSQRDSLVQGSDALPGESRRAEMQSMFQRYNLGSWRGGAQETHAGPETQSGSNPVSAPTSERQSSDWSAFVASAIANRTDLGIKRTGETVSTLPAGMSPGFTQTAPRASAREAVIDQGPGSPASGYSAASGQNSPVSQASPPIQSTPPVQTTPLIQGSPPSQTTPLIQASPPSLSITTTPQATASNSRPTAYGAITLFGDSVLLGARGLIERHMTEANVHAEVGWQASDVLNTIQRVRESGELHPIVLIHLGTNGYVTLTCLRIGKGSWL